LLLEQNGGNHLGGAGCLLLHHLHGIVDGVDLLAHVREVLVGRLVNVCLALEEVLEHNV
jgi:hypothetical protein